MGREHKKRVQTLQGPGQKLCDFSKSRTNIEVGYILILQPSTADGEPSQLSSRNRCAMSALLLKADIRSRRAKAAFANNGRNESNGRRRIIATPAS
jgi:hypothetical protein